MKLRVHGNSVRLRLRKSEIARFEELGELAETLTIGSGHLGYKLSSADIPALEAEFHDGSLIVRVPREQVRQWCETEDVGIYVQTPTVEVILEKEFRRTSAKTEFDEDLYPNPRARKHLQQIDEGEERAG